MALPRPVSPVLLVVVGFSRHASALEWARGQLQERFGPIALSSTPYLFNQTRYYEASMGEQLQKQLWAFERLIAPDSLPDHKLTSNALEQCLADSAAYTEPRPLNLDPGYLALGKFVLATTKDQAHRLYLRDGIHAEVTLHYQAGHFRPWPWTYADYRQECVLAFLDQARDYYRQALLRWAAQTADSQPTSPCH